VDRDPRIKALGLGKRRIELEFVIDNLTMGYDFHIMGVRAKQGGNQLNFDRVGETSIPNNGSSL